MRIKFSRKIGTSENIKALLLEIGSSFEPFILLDSNSTHTNDYSKLYKSKFELLSAFGCVTYINSQTKGAFERLKAYYNNTNDWLFGHLGYSLHEDTENIQSTFNSAERFPAMYFFQPLYVVYVANNVLHVEYIPELSDNAVINRLKNIEIPINVNNEKGEQIKVCSKIDKPKYIDKILAIKQHIAIGNLYETNYCIEFYNDNIVIDPYSVYNRLTSVAPTPFSAFYKNNNSYLLCSSPERYISNTGGLLVSQPIKGTLSSALSKDILRNNKKEVAENIMVTDLVRNDLSHIAEKGTVNVDELCGIYTFSRVHQMISTISCRLRADVHPIDALRHTFPMGSMTGAPKIRAIQICNELEPSTRGIYSGSVGYFTPEGDFDFNVVIRSIVYNKLKKYLSFHVGSAITAGSIPETEYDECLLKAEAMLYALNATIC